MYTNPSGEGSPVWVLSKIFGLNPFSWIGHFQLTPLNVAYTLLCFTINLLCWIISFVLAGPIELFPIICQIGHYMHTTLQFLVASLAFAVAIPKVHEINSMVTQLTEVDRTLEKITNFPVNYQRACNAFQQRLVIGSNVGFAIICIGDSAIFFGLFGPSVLITEFAYMFPYLVSSTILFQFITFVFHMSLRFKHINQALLHISTVNEVTSKAVKMYSDINANFPNNGNAKPPTPILFITEDNIDEIPIKPTDRPDATAQANRNGAQPKMPANLHIHMDKLFTLHDKLLDMSELVNRIYALQIVSFITVAFIVILFGFFFETKVIFWLWGQNTRLILIATSYLLWGIMMALVIYTMLTICTRTRDEAYESALIVHKILQNKPVFMLNDEIYYNKMKSFTLQILHRKNTFNFNGLGMFHLDYTFIFSAVSAATSYLIVLLQFDLAADLS